MASGNARLVVEVVATSAQFQADLGKAAAVAAQQAKRIERSMEDLKHRALDLGKTAIGALGFTLGAEGLVRAFEAIGEKALEEERSLNQLNAALIATGSAAGLTAQQLNALNSSVQSKSIFDDDAIRKAEVALLRFRTVQGDVFKQAIALTPDLASAMGSDLPAAAQVLGRALSEPGASIRQLKALGIELSQQQIDLAQRFVEAGNKAAGQQIVLDELRKSIGGTAEADNSGLYGATKRLARSFGDLEKVAGRKVLGDNGPIIQGLTVAFDALAHKIDETDFSWQGFLRRAVVPAGLLQAIQLAARAFGGKPSAPKTAAGAANAQLEAETDANMAAAIENERQFREQQYLDQQSALKARAANAAVYYAGELSRQKSFIDQFNADLQFGYARGTVTIEDFFNEQKKLAEAGFESTARSLGKQGEAQEAIIGSLHSTRDERDAARVKLLQIANAHDDALYARDLKLLQLNYQQIEAVERLADSYKTLRASVAEQEGDPVTAARLNNEVQNRALRNLLETRANRGSEASRAEAQQLLDLLNRKEQFAVDRAAEAVQHTVNDITAQLLTLQGNTASATALHLHDANEDIRRQLTNRGDTATLARLDEIERLSVAQARLNDLQGAYNLAIDELGVKQGRIDLQAQTGAITELDAINQRSAAAKAYVDALRPVADEYDRIALASGNPQLIVNAEKFRLALEQIGAQADELRKKFEDVFTGSFADALTSFATGTKSAKDALKDMLKSIEQQISQIASKNIAEALFGKSGPLGGVSDFFAKMFGGGKSDQGPSDAAGGFLSKILGGGTKAASDATGAAALTSAGGTLTAAGTTMTTAASLLTTAATSLQAAATSLAAGGGGGLGGLLGGGGTLFGPGAIDVGDNFAGGIPFFASGTDFHAGGLAVVGEKGPELVNLPRGAQVIPNDVLRAKRAERQGQSVTITNHITVMGNASSKTVDQMAVEVGRRTQRALARNA